MEILALYVDKYYVVGVQCIDGITKSIVLPNGEDRIWLYFFEDINHDKIVYGKSNESHYLNNEPHYYGDVFSKILDFRNEFTRFHRKKALREIFFESKIFDNLKKPFSSERGIDTYVSFSTDVPLAARSMFLEELSEAGFSVNVSVARMEHLALEYARSSDQLSERGQYLVMNALNDNLNYSIYEYTGDIFVRKAQDKLPGLGSDLRGRALVEEIVKKANFGSTHFLETPHEIEAEHRRLTKLFLDGWIIKLDNAKPNIPFSIDNVWFAVAPNNKQTIQIRRRDIDEHTKAIVDQIVREIGKFASKNDAKDNLKGLILLGNTFSNSVFDATLKEYFNLSAKPIIRYRITDIGNIVSMYLSIDCEQFSSDAKQFSINAETEKIRIENAIKEEEDNKKALKEQEEKEQRERAAYDAEKMYNAEMQGVYEYESNKDYVRMLESCEAALKHKPNDSEALKKKKEAERNIAREDVKSEQYNEAIKKAKEKYEAGQYNEALFYSENALALRRDSAEAKRIKESSRNIMESQSRIEKFITRADLFIGQKLYDNAISELQKILTIDPNNKEAKSRLDEINTIQQRLQDELDKLKKQLSDAKSSGNYVAAIDICEKLKETDSLNLPLWNEEIRVLKGEKEKKEKELKTLLDLRSKIDLAVFEENWALVVSLCNESLQIIPDKSIQDILDRGRQKLDEEIQNKKFQEELDTVKVLIADKKWEDAEKKLNALQHDFPGRDSIYKPLRIVIFQAQDSISKQEKEIKQKTNTIGFKTSKKEAMSFDEDWSIPPKPSEKKNKKNSQKHSSEDYTGDDFFDNDNEIQKEKNKIKQLSLTDFNF